MNSVPERPITRRNFFNNTGNLRTGVLISP